MSISGLFIVNTPLHLLYAKDACLQFNIIEQDLIIILKRPSDKPQMEAMLLEQSWNSVNWIDAISFFKNNFIALYELYLTFNLKLRKLHFDYVVFADYGQTMAANIPSETCVILGDGSKIIYQHSEEFLRSRNRFEKQLLIEKWLTRPFGWFMLPKERPTVFTPYKIDSKYSVIENSMSWIGSKYRVIQNASFKNKEIYFFGAYFCESEKFKLMTEREYLEIMRLVCDYYIRLGFDRFFYIPHRHEDKEKVDKIGEFSGVEIMTFEFPVEYGFLDKGIFPKNIGSFFSSCLFHFSRFELDINITAFYVDFDGYNSNYKEEADVIYRALRDALGENSVINIESIR